MSQEHLLGPQVLGHPLLASHLDQMWSSQERNLCPCGLPKLPGGGVTYCTTMVTPLTHFFNWFSLYLKSRKRTFLTIPQMPGLGQGKVRPQVCLVLPYLNHHWVPLGVYISRDSEPGESWTAGIEVWDRDTARGVLAVTNTHVGNQVLQS